MRSSLAISIVGVGLVAVGFLALQESGPRSSGAIPLVCIVGGGGLLVVLWPPARLREQRNSLRPLKGKTVEEVERVLGEPMAVERDRKAGHLYLTWRAMWYSVTLAFKDDVCIGLKREDHP